MILSQHWIVEVTFPDGTRHQLGPEHGKISDAVWCVEKIYKPLLGKKHWSKKTTFAIYKIKVVKTSEAR
jgi:hypothetical protein